MKVLCNCSLFVKYERIIFRGYPQSLRHHETAAHQPIQLKITTQSKMSHLQSPHTRSCRRISQPLLISSNYHIPTRPTQYYEEHHFAIILHTHIFFSSSSTGERKTRKKYSPNYFHISTHVEHMTPFMVHHQKVTFGIWFLLVCVLAARLLFHTE
jgi:hypothetical protein